MLLNTWAKCLLFKNRDFFEYSLLHQQLSTHLFKKSFIRLNNTFPFVSKYSPFMILFVGPPFLNWQNWRVNAKISNWMKKKIFRHNSDDRDIIQLIKRINYKNSETIFLVVIQNEIRNKVSKVIFWLLGVRFVSVKIN